MNNIFENPRKFIREFIDKEIITKETIDASISDYRGLSMMCAWLTKKCPLSCTNCFFKSNMECSEMLEEEHTLSDEGISKLTKFINDSNSGYLMLSGGGDPFMCKNKLFNVIRGVITKRIVVVTSGYWAKDYLEAEKIINEMYEAYTDNPNHMNCIFVLRLSVDLYHEKALNGKNSFYNIINIYRQKYKNYNNFILMIHTLANDDTIEKIAIDLDATLSACEYRRSDNNEVIKIMPKKSEMIFDNNYKIEIGISKLFYSNLLVDLNNKNSIDIKNAIKVITEDMEMSEQDNPSFIQNTSGEKGLDFWVDYNGNITTWFNQDLENLYNIYVDDYYSLVEGTFRYPVTSRFLKKGYQYRNSIVEEVNPTAVLRAQSINLRDYVSTIILEENKTKLYYSIRVIQDYIKEFYLNNDNLKELSFELQHFIQMDRHSLKQYYDKSSFDILVQYLDENNFEQQKWSDLFVLIKLGHYVVSNTNLNKYLEIYRKNIGIHEISLNYFKTVESVIDYQRFHQRLSFIKPEAMKHLTNSKI